ncbi:MAG: response regulator [Bacteroidia bacterium]|nr:response regulator [Bacteroidia bacterium]MDW8159024.1 response regulator [Bacteroidia bacterium]
MEKVILCVDDEKIVTDTLISQLRNELGEEYFFESASDAAEAWEIIEELVADQLHIRLIISDWLMPKVKGDKFLLEVFEQYPHIKLVMLSGQADEAAIKNLENKIPDFKFLRKPWAKSELIELVKSLLKN